MTSNHAEPPRARKTANALACGIDDAFISPLMEIFLETVRQGDMLGPTFAERIGDWPHHLTRMKDFWATIIFDSGRFSGNPMRRDIAIDDLDKAHFVCWRSHRNRTFDRIAPNATVADRFRETTQRIGENLLMGIRIERGRPVATSTRTAS